MGDYLKIKLEYRSCRAVPKSWVTCVHRGKRVASDALRRNWGLDELPRVLWSSEAKFEVTGNQRREVYCCRGSK